LFRIAFSALSIVLVTACGTPQTGTTVPDVTIDDSFGRPFLTRNDGVKLPYRVGIIEDQGTYLVCVAAQNIRTAQERKVLAALKVTINGETLIRGLGWARTYASIGDLNGQQAACRKTLVPIVDDPQIGIELTKTSFSRERG
jgi:hypothetical protein